SGPTTVTGDVAGLVVEAVGTTTVTYSARDEAGNVSAPQVVEVTIVGAPAAPSGVSAGLGDGSSVVSWSAPAPADVVTGYEITPVRDGVAEAVQVFGAGTSALVTGLVNGSSYRFSVVAVNAFGPGPARLSPVVTVGVPSHPSSLRSAAGNGSASLTWAPPPAMGVAPTGYEITPLLDGVTPLAPVTVGVVTAATVSGLANGSTYTFRIVTLSVNGPGLGATFPAVTVGVPLHPSGLKASPGNAVANLSWTAPPAMGVAPTGYEITPLLDGVTPLAPVTVGAVTSTTITGLGNGVTYGFEIVTLSPFGRSAPVSFPLVTVGVLNPPTTLRTTSGNGQATLTWVEPVTVGIAVTGYRITPVKGGVLQAPVDIGPGTSTTITGLTNGSVYAFRVVALSTYGTSANATFPAVTIGVPGNPTGLSAVAGDGQATVSWTAPADIGVPVTGYRVTPYIGSTAQTPTTTSGPGTTATVTGLANGTSYTFRVVTLSAFGESGYAKSMAVKIGTLGAPKLPRATSGNEQATLTWQPPTDTGIPVAGYRITPYLGAVQLAPTTVGPVTSTTITDLANGSTYTFRVEALSTGGTGTAAIAPAVTIGVPTFPSTLRSYPGDGEADLTWIAPPDIGVAVTGYRITPYIAGVAQPDITVGPVTATTVTGLTNGTTYTFRIATLTEHGASTTAKFPDVTPTAPT
ncbi:MAG: fibronectin type III domain-containing protein, partial [Actinobacteria bacterium]|nr:fibronectin type III domain-containing protein [Actinomycetota bacterium]